MRCVSGRSPAISEWRRAIKAITRRGAGTAAGGRGVEDHAAEGRELVDGAGLDERVVAEGGGAELGAAAVAFDVRIGLGQIRYVVE